MLSPIPWYAFLLLGEKISKSVCPSWHITFSIYPSYWPKRHGPPDVGMKKAVFLGIEARPIDDLEEIAEGDPFGQALVAGCESASELQGLGVGFGSRKGIETDRPKCCSDAPNGAI